MIPSPCARALIALVSTLVIFAAVDGVCLQTSESIGCAEELGLPVVVALNKIDLVPERDVAQVISATLSRCCLLSPHPVFGTEHTGPIVFV